MLDFLINLPGSFPSVERSGFATNSELRRWFERGSVEVNGHKARWNDPVPEQWGSLIVHPRSVRRTTLW
jgi:hypothetical protein